MYGGHVAIGTVGESKLRHSKSGEVVWWAGVGWGWEWQSLWGNGGGHGPFRGNCCIIFWYIRAKRSDRFLEAYKQDFCEENHITMFSCTRDTKPQARGLSLMAGCLTFQQDANTFQKRICWDNCMCCHTETEVENQTCYLILCRSSDTMPTSPSADPVTPDV